MFQYSLYFIFYVLLVDIIDTVIFGICWYWTTKAIRKFLSGRILEYYNDTIGYIVIYAASFVIASVTFYFYSYVELNPFLLIFITLFVLYINYLFLLRRRKSIMVFYFIVYIINLFLINYLVKY